MSIRFARPSCCADRSQPDKWTELTESSSYGRRSDAVARLGDAWDSDADVWSVDVEPVARVACVHRIPPTPCLGCGPRSAWFRCTPATLPVPVIDINLSR